MLGDFVNLDVGVDADIAPHPDDRLDHFVILRLEAARRLDGELDRLLFGEPAGREQLRRQRRIEWHLDRRIERRVFRRLEGSDRYAVTTQELLDDRIFVDGVTHRQTNILVVHQPAVGDEDHTDIRNRRCYALQAGLGLEPVELLVRHFECDVGRTAFDFGDAARRIRDELEHDGLERGLAAPVFRICFEPQISVALVGVDHVGAGADRILLEAAWADLLVIGLRQHVAGEERHPLEDDGIVLLDVGGDALAVDLEVVDAGPDERYRVAAIGLARALDRPHDVFGRKRGAVMPDDIFADVHPDLALVVVPTPTGKQAGLERQIRFLTNILIEDRAIDRLDRRIDRRGPDVRVKGRDIDVVGDAERVADRRAGETLRQN